MTPREESVRLVGSARGDNVVPLFEADFTPTEKAWIHACMMRGVGNAVAERVDAVMRDLVRSGRVTPDQRGVLELFGRRGDRPSQHKAPFARYCWDAGMIELERALSAEQPVA